MRSCWPRGEACYHCRSPLKSPGDLVDTLVEMLRKLPKRRPSAWSVLWRINRLYNGWWTFHACGSILDATVANMTAIGNLIRRATETHQDIVITGSTHGVIDHVES